jgi:hypothetical protein
MGEVVEKRLDCESGEAKRFCQGLKEPVPAGIEEFGVAPRIRFSRAAADSSSAQPPPALATRR